MTPKEQWIKFYQHAYTDGTKVPNPLGLYVVPTEMSGLMDRLPDYLDSGKDWFGVEWVKDGSIKVTIPDPRAKFMLEDIADWREVVQWPDLDTFDFKTAAKNSGLDQVDRSQHIIYFVMAIGPFERLHTLMGFEESLMALLTDPEECDEFFTAFMDWRCRLIEKVKEYYDPDVIMYHDDIGTQTDMFFDPDLWRRLMKPHLKRATDKIHELGMFMEYHSCGKHEQVISDLVEIGVDAWQGQEINDILAMKKITQGKLEYHPILDYQHMVTKHNCGKITMDEIRASVRESIVKNMAGGHYAPVMQPLGEEVSIAMTEEFVKVCLEYTGDPE